MTGTSRAGRGPRVRTRAGRAAALLAAACAAALFAGCPGGAGGGGTNLAPPRTNVLLVSIDTLRADHLGCYGHFRDTSPVIDALARESVFFELGLTPMATTLPAHLTLLTGVHPIEHGVLANAKHGAERFERPRAFRSFATFARERGYRTSGVVSATPVTAKTGIAAGFDDWFEPKKVERRAAATNADVFAWLDGAGDAPFFLFVHYFDPHGPYEAPPPFDTMFGPGAALDAHVAARRMPETLVRPNERVIVPREAINAYDGEIRYVDRQVGVLFDRLRALGLWDDTLVILLSDHGEGLGEHGMAGHGYVHREQIHVPLMIRAPGVAPRRVARAVSLADVLPTAIGLLGERDHAAWRGFLEQASGRDVLAPGAEERPVVTRRSEREREDIEGTALSVATRHWKYVHEPSVGERLFDWSSDPLELENVVTANPERAARMKDALLERVAAYEARHAAALAESGAVDDAEVDDAHLERLRALGYVE